MIFTTRAIKVKLLTPKDAISDLILHQLKDKSAENYRRENYFIRYIGFDENEQSYIEKLKNMDGRLRGSNGYLRVQGLNRQFPIEQTNQFIALYERWNSDKHTSLEQLIRLPFPMKFKNAMLQLTQVVAFEKVMTLFERSNPNANASIKKNFAVSILGLSYYYLPKIFGKEEMLYGKIVYIGEIKRQELYFLYYLHLLGCDILYIDPEKDMKDKYPECESFSTLIMGREKRWIDIAKQLDTVQSVRQETAIRQSTQRGVNGSTSEQRQQNQQPAVVSQSGSGRGSIHLGHAHTTTGVPMTEGNVKDAQTQPTQVPPPVQITPRREVARQTPVRPVGGLVHPRTQRAPDRELSYEELARLSTSVVMIGVADERGEVRGSGSGVVINGNGYIITNYHVVSHGVRYFVKFENEPETYETTRIIKYHPEYDLAIIKVTKQCQPIHVYDGHNIVRGQKVVAIGSPLGLFNSVSDGIVSAFRHMENGRSMIQFTAPISSGSSGGAVLDLYGNLIGISTAGFDDGQNLNLAVDSECIRQFAGSYINM